jgi:hypothetical protein
MTFEDATQKLYESKQDLGSDITPNPEAQDEVYDKYQPSFRPGRVGDIKEQEIVSFLKYENNRHWTGLVRSKNKITADIEALREGLSTLVDEEQPLDSRFTEAVRLVHGMGTAIATAILHVAYPDKYGVWNGTSKGGMKQLGLWPDFKRGSSIGEQYEKVNRVLNRLAEEIDTDLWTLDILWHKLGDEEEEIEETREAESEQRFGLERHLQDFLRDNWAEMELLSGNWELYEDETGPYAGYEYTTSVGSIDLLAQHRTEPRWLVIELKRGRTSDQTVGQVLRYIGAVRREVAEEEDAIEGLIIAQDATDKLRYALGELSSVTFRRYKVEFELLPDGATPGDTG